MTLNKSTVWKFIKLLSLFFFSMNGFAEDFAGKRILYVNAYHQGYPWSDGISEAIQRILKNAGVELKIAYMDTKRRSTDESKRVAALRIKAQIEHFKPDLVITSDDDPARYLIVPYFKDEALPFIFCGINWDVSAYEFPYKNVTGMLEISRLDEIIHHLLRYAKGKRVGFLSGDGFSERKEQEGYEKHLNFHFDKVYFANNFEEWKQQLLTLQNEVDVLILENPKTIPGWNDPEAQRFVEKNIRVPFGGAHAWLAPLVLLGIVKDPKEQGEWAANTALKILAGTSPQEISISHNQHDVLYLNQKLARKLGITFSAQLLKNAAHIIQ
ncbi:MAG: ABC transporter substrate binding protein [Thiotrichaceae bacterium]|nr:ABC transporter substrate binding protein [Thiotrichaceae bacterium]